jgi:methylmalonyl-CoA/ethylmalonyl-CoA epimerase
MADKPKKQYTGKEALKLRPHHWGISVPDMDAAAAWYRDKLGFTEALRLDLKGVPGGMKIVFLRLGDFYVEIFQAPPGAERRGAGDDMKSLGIKHMCLWVDDMHEAIAILKARGVEFTRDPSDQEHPHAAFIHDNFGNMIELVPSTAPEPI